MQTEVPGVFRVVVYYIKIISCINIQIRFILQIGLLCVFIAVSITTFFPIFFFSVQSFRINNIFSYIESLHNYFFPSHIIFWYTLGVKHQKITPVLFQKTEFEYHIRKFFVSTFLVEVNFLFSSRVLRSWNLSSFILQSMYTCKWHVFRGRIGFCDILVTSDTIW